MKNLKMIFLPMLFLPLYLGANNFEELYKNTKSGGTLTLTKGVYQVNDFVIDKPIQIVGESGAVLDRV
jgi:hypothetical protein